MGFKNILWQGSGIKQDSSNRLVTDNEKTTWNNKANNTHTHAKSDIKDFPSSLPASDVYSWAKASTKPSYTKSEVGLSNVDNTADSAKSVKYATSAGSATTASQLMLGSRATTFNWYGQGGQPEWLFGSNESNITGGSTSNVYVYNPSNFLGSTCK